MDLVGIAMGWVTIPMAVLSIASVLGAIRLLVGGQWELVVTGGTALAAGLICARALEGIVVRIDDLTVRTCVARGRAAGRAIAVLSAAIPVGTVLAWECACFIWFMDQASISRPALWLLSYGVATGPFTLAAFMVSRFRRTLCGIRAYAGHIAYWILSLSGLGARIGPGWIWGAMLIPAALPLTVGVLLALADRDALTNVRV